MPFLFSVIIHVFPLLPVFFVPILYNVALWVGDFLVDILVDNIKIT